MYQTHHLYHFLAICNTAHLVPKKKSYTNAQHQYLQLKVKIIFSSQSQKKLSVHFTVRRHTYLERRDRCAAHPNITKLLNDEAAKSYFIHQKALE